MPFETSKELISLLRWKRTLSMQPREGLPHIQIEAHRGRLSGKHWTRTSGYPSEPSLKGLHKSSAVQGFSGPVEFQGIHMCIYIYMYIICVYIPIHICMYVYIHIYTHAHTRTCIHKYVDICTAQHNTTHKATPRNATQRNAAQGQRRAAQRNAQHKITQHKTQHTTHTTKHNTKHKTQNTKHKTNRKTQHTTHNNKVQFSTIQYITIKYNTVAYSRIQ